MTATPLLLDGFSFEVTLWEPQGFFSRWHKPRKVVRVSRAEHDPVFDPDDLRNVCSREAIVESLGRSGPYFLATRSVIVGNSGAGDAVAGMSIDPSSVVFYAPGNTVIAVFTQEAQAKIVEWLKLI